MGLRLVEDVKPISYIKTNAADMLSYINQSKNPIVITQNGEARGVLLDIESYQSMTDALVLMKLIERSESDIQLDKTVEHGHAMHVLEQKLGIHG